MTATAPAERPCSAKPLDDLMVCDRCGLEWLAGVEKPACQPITFEMLRARILREVNNAEASLNAMRAMRKDGMPADVEYGRRRFVEMEKLRVLVERCTTDDAILTHLKPRQSQPAGSAGKPERT